MSTGESRPHVHADWIVPEWPAPSGIKALITTRNGGVSPPPFESFNLGYASGDDAAHVAENRARLRAVLPQEPRWLRQVHGAGVVAANSVDTPPDADASFTYTQGTVCAVLVADCLPVLIAARDGSVVAAAHAGWRGLAAGILDNTVVAMCATTLQPRDLVAYIGPGIGPHVFEVGEDVLEAYLRIEPHAAAAFRPKARGKWLADLPCLARATLNRCGVNSVHGGSMCTYSDPARFYSYRRDGTTGRMAALIWRERL